MKHLVAKILAKRVVDGETIGLGSGSTAELAVKQIGERISREKIRISGVPTSHQIALVLKQANLSSRER